MNTACAVILVVAALVSVVDALTLSSPVKVIQIYKNLDALSRGVCDDFVSCAQHAIAIRGVFIVAIPGGSVLKMLNGLQNQKNAVDWSKVKLFYVNHKCLPPDDASATHFKAKSLFLDTLSSIQVFPLKISKDNNLFADAANIQASIYEQQIRSHVALVNGLPVFDYMLLGVGKDGHIGSLYPGRKEVDIKDAYVVPVDKKTPASITLTFPIINAAKHTRIVMSGADKAEAVVVGALRTKPASEFPVCGVEGVDVKWMVDEAGSLVATKTECIMQE
jgi:6-phosphogluconolactonase